MRNETYADKVSIIMAVYNAARWIDSAIESIQSQTHTNWELVAVDDGSTDNSLKKLQEWSNTDSRIYVFHKENGGITKARALALTHAEGDYVFIMDSDDRISPDLLSSCLSSIENSHADAAMPNLMQEMADGSWTNHFSKYGISPYEVIDGQEAFFRSINWRGIWGPMMCKTAIYKNVVCDEKYWYGNMNSEELVTRVVVANCARVVYSPGTYYYYHNNESNTRTLSVKRIGFLETDLRLIETSRELRQPINVIAKTETQALRNMIEMWQEHVDDRRLYSKQDQKTIEKKFRNSYKRLTKDNIQALLSSRKGLTPKIQKMVLLHGWCLFDMSIRASKWFGFGAKLNPWFSDEELKTLIK